MLLLLNVHYCVLNLAARRRVRKGDAMSIFPYVSLWFSPSETLRRWEECCRLTQLGVLLAVVVTLVLGSFGNAGVVAVQGGLRAPTWPELYSLMLAAPLHDVTRYFFVGCIFLLIVHFSWYGAIWGAGIFFGGESDDQKFKGYLLLMFIPASIQVVVNTVLRFGVVNHQISLLWWVISIVVDGWISTELLVAVQQLNRTVATVLFCLIALVYSMLILPSLYYLV